MDFRSFLSSSFLVVVIRSNEMSNDISQNGGEPSDTELRELVYQSLERDGLITRLKAQLRAAVFKTIEKSSTFIDNELNPPKKGNRTDELCRGIVFDWLEQSNLLYTQDLFKIELSDSISTRTNLINELHLDNRLSTTQSILHHLIECRQTTRLPNSIKQSIDGKFVNEHISDQTRLREHFRSLFSHAFDVSILDSFFNKHLPSTKSDYERMCLKWIQSCSKILESPSHVYVFVCLFFIQTTMDFSRRNGHVVVTQARRSFSPPSDSTSSSSTSQSENPRKSAFDLVLPTIVDDKRKTIEVITNGHKNLPIEYDDETTSQIDDVTVDKASPSPSTAMDFLEDLE